MSTDRVAIDYKTHILIGVRVSGIMAVIADWPHVPAQSEVQAKIDGTYEIGIGGSLAAPPLPHHRAYGSVHGGSSGWASAPRPERGDRAIGSAHWKAQ